MKKILLILLAVAIIVCFDIFVPVTRGTKFAATLLYIFFILWVVLRKEE